MAAFIFNPDHLNFLHSGSKAVSFCYSCVHPCRHFNFQELFLCVPNLISGFGFKLTDVLLFLLRKHLEAIVGLVTGLISTLLCLREQGGGRSRREKKE